AAVMATSSHFQLDRRSLQLPAFLFAHRNASALLSPKFEARWLPLAARHFIRGDGMIDRGKRRGTSDLAKLFDTHATWVVRAKSGVIGNAPSLRAALELAARKSDNGLVESIISATRFENERVHIPSRQVRQLIELQNRTPRQSNSAPKRRLPFS